MKKQWTITIVMVLLFFWTAPVWAVLGIPDDVPGKDILVPFFYVSMSGFGNDNTIITIAEVNGTKTTLHWVAYRKNGVHQYNDSVTINPCDVFTTNALTIIHQMPKESRKYFEFDSDGDGISDHWVGYIYYQNKTNENHLIATVYQANLLRGKASSYSSPRFEYSSIFADPRQHSGEIEVFSANSLWVAKNLLAGNGVPALDTSFFRLIFFYIIPDEQSRNLIITWTEPSQKRASCPRNMTCSFSIGDKGYTSFTIPITYGLNIIDIKNYIPTVLQNDYPITGWIDIKNPDLDGDGLDGDRTWLGYVWQGGTKSESDVGSESDFAPVLHSWDFLKPADRQTERIISIYN